MANIYYKEIVAFKTEKGPVILLSCLRCGNTVEDSMSSTHTTDHIRRNDFERDDDSGQGHQS